MVNPAWMPPPEEFPPIPERAKNLARHFGLIALVIAILGTPMIFTIMARWHRPKQGKTGLRQLGTGFAHYEARFRAYPMDLAEMDAGLALIAGEPGVDGKCGACGADFDGWWNYRGFERKPGDVYYWKDRLTDAAPQDLPVAWCPRCGEVLCFQGSIEAAARTQGLVRK